MSDSSDTAGPRQLSLPLSAQVDPQRRSGGLRLIQGEARRVQEPLQSRDSVVRVLVEAGADLLLRRISVERAEEIEASVERVLDLFDRADRAPEVLTELQSELDALEELMGQTRQVRGRRVPWR